MTDRRPADRPSADWPSADWPGLASLACYTVDIPARGGSYAMSHGRVLTSFPATVVKVTAQDGTTGFGEAGTLGGNYLDGFPGSARETIRELAPWVLECDPLEPGVLADGMDARVIGHLPGKAAIDIALWDLRGKLLGLPVARLLGGVRQRSLAAFQAISLGSPQEMAKDVGQLSGLGFRHWQLKLGDDPLADARRVHAVTEALPADSAFLTSDANRGWTVSDTLRFVRAVAGADTYLEQPCQTLAELARVRPHCPLPMMVDEGVKEPADLLAAVTLGCADAINIKPSRVGGLTKAARIRDLALAAGVMILVDEPQGAELATAGMAQLAATVNPGSFIAMGCFVGDHMPSCYRPPGREAAGARFEGGRVTWPDAPGLGVEVDEDRLGPPVFELSRPVP
ncbi:MAG TPA: enolase C-terminal domain-like protein [Streptosporangiaceae bacterium]